MAAFGSVAEMGYVALRTRDLSASIKSATEVLGLHALETTGAKALLAAAGQQPELVYLDSDVDGVDHIGLVVQDTDNLAAIRDKVAHGGWPVIAEQPIADYAAEGFAFVGPEGYTFHVYRREAVAEVPTGGFGPERFGHVNIKVHDTIGMRDFLINTLGFRVTDQIGDDIGFFMRCNHEHHAIAVLKDAVPGLHHHAWKTQTMTDLGRMGDRLARRGGRLFWGPVRHGAGHNIAVYYQEPTGNLIELYIDLETVWNEGRQIVKWAPDDLFWINQWDGYVPEGLPGMGIGPISR